MKKHTILLFIAVISVLSARGQSKDREYYSPVFAVKTNVLYLATTTLNLGVEVALSKKLTLDVSGNYNPWEFTDNRQLKHWGIQPELRYWLCNRFSGHFFGVHGHYAEYNGGNFKELDLEGIRYEGNLYGGGISYGYHWILNKRWSLEGVVGLGYAYLDYDKYNANDCGAKIKEDNRHYFGPTKLALSLIYVIK